MVAEIQVAIDKPDVDDGLKKTAKEARDVGKAACQGTSEAEKGLEELQAEIQETIDKTEELQDEAREVGKKGGGGGAELGAKAIAAIGIIKVVGETISAPRVECRRRESVRTIILPSVVRGKNHTKSFVRLVVDLRKMMTIQDIADDLGVSTRMIRHIDKQSLKRRLGKPKLKSVK